MGAWAAIKYALNSTVGTSGFKSLDKLIDDKLSTLKSKSLKRIEKSIAAKAASFTYSGSGVLKAFMLYYPENYGYTMNDFKFIVDGNTLLHLDEANLTGRDYLGCLVQKYNPATLKYPGVYSCFDLEKYSAETVRSEIPATALDVAFSKSITISTSNTNGFLKDGKVKVVLFVEQYV